jgi:hypothetical protein
MSINIDVIADTTYEKTDNGFLDEQAKLYPGAIRSLTLSDMITKVITRVGSTPIKTLRIFGHGSAGRQWVGGGFSSGSSDVTRIAAQTIRFANGALQDTALLARLAGRFVAGGSPSNPEGLVELHGCSVGKTAAGQGLARALAQLWNVRARAGTDLQYADAPGKYEGGYIEAVPLGTVFEHTFGGLKYLLVPPWPTAAPSPTPDKPVIHEIGAVVTKADWLSSLAGQFYGDVLLWPIIFDKNRSATFTNPNAIRPKQKIEIPPLPKLTPQEREQVRRRGLDWRSYNQ